MARCASFFRRTSIGMLSVSLAGSAVVHTPAAWAQAAASGAVSGFVLDPDQAAIPGAVVTLTPQPARRVPPPLVPTEATASAMCPQALTR